MPSAKVNLRNDDGVFRPGDPVVNKHARSREVLYFVSGQTEIEFGAGSCT